MATTYRRPTTVTRNGKTFPRAGGPVRYNARQDENPLLDAARGVGGWLGGRLWDGLEAVTSRRGARARREQDRRMHQLMAERRALMLDIAANDPEDRARWDKIKRVQEIDREWKRAAGAQVDEPERPECRQCGGEFDPEDGTVCEHGETLCSSLTCRANGCKECAGEIDSDDYR